MADIIKISDATALALHSMVQLATDPQGQSTTAEIAELFDASRHHLAKVHQRLTKAGLIHSQRGPSGGVGLAKAPGKITLLEIYEVMEGSMLCNPCLFGKDVCPRTDCVLGALLPGLARQVRDYFEQTTLAQLANESNWGKTTK
ncbi:RrF2 family transcriptional regulator [Pontiella sulfatireligans]|uniref:HTH-type transcriptional regulator CymR n=1 Tax=Pontiella sulfatireligans TaxID=2750658 RepID=A0A6C2UQJ3_9BACT|nr:Rrf2 family transcriptional regulator [Pontiella sulfatireligans]VGO21541.1 HTH-type transcriptional regulator CymR [Pontiella sulfatireligans]